MENSDIIVNYSPGDIIHLAIAVAIIAAGLLSVFYIFAGGISFILSGGEEDKIKKAMQTVRYAIIGLLMTLFAIFIISTIGKFLNIDLIPFFSWERMTTILQETMDRVFNDSTSTSTL